MSVSVLNSYGVLCQVYGVDNFSIFFCMLQRFMLVINRLEDKYELYQHIEKGIRRR